MTISPTERQLPFRACATHKHHAAFTLLELLLVVAILSIVTAILIPQIGAGISGTQLTTAARTTLQAARYARTMALLNQAETELTIGSKTGLIRVTAVGEAAAQVASERLERSAAAKEAAHTPLATPEGDLFADATTTNLAAAEATARSFADEIATEYRCEKIAFRFLGYTDSLERTNATQLPAAESEDIRIRFRSNGTCRPFKLRLFLGAEDESEAQWLEIEFDMMGSGKVHHDAA